MGFYLNKDLLSCLFSTLTPKMYRNFYKKMLDSAVHEKHLWALYGFIGGAPLLSITSIAWCYSKSEAALIRFADAEKWNSIDITKPVQTIFSHGTHRASYVKDPAVDALRNEVYAFENFSKIEERAPTKTLSCYTLC